MGIAAFVVHRKVVAYFSAVLLLIGGVASFRQLSRLEDPDFTGALAIRAEARPVVARTERWELELAADEGTVVHVEERRGDSRRWIVSADDSGFDEGRLRVGPSAAWRAFDVGQRQEWERLDGEVELRSLSGDVARCRFAFVTEVEDAVEVVIRITRGR